MVRVPVGTDYPSTGFVILFIFSQKSEVHDCIIYETHIIHVGCVSVKSLLDGYYQRHNYFCYLYRFL